MVDAATRDVVNEAVGCWNAGYELGYYDFVEAYEQDPTDGRSDTFVEGTSLAMEMVDQDVSCPDGSGYWTDRTVIEEDHTLPASDLDQEFVDRLTALTAQIRADGRDWGRRHCAEAIRDNRDTVIGQIEQDIKNVDNDPDYTQEERVEFRADMADRLAGYDHMLDTFLLRHTFAIDNWPPS